MLFLYSCQTKPKHPPEAGCPARWWACCPVVGAATSSARPRSRMMSTWAPAFSQAACQLSRLVVPVLRSQRMSTWAPAFSQAACQLSRLAAPVLRSQRMSTWTPAFSQAAFSQCYGADFFLRLKQTCYEVPYVLKRHFYNIYQEIVPMIEATEQELEIEPEPPVI